MIRRPPRSTPKQSGDTEIDLTKYTVMPGLIDVHTHLTMTTNFDPYFELSMTPAKEAILGVENAKVTLEAGFTTVRNVGANDYTDLALRDEINAGHIPGPHMQPSGPSLGLTGRPTRASRLPQRRAHSHDAEARAVPRPYRIRPRLGAAVRQTSSSLPAEDEGRQRRRKAERHQGHQGRRQSPPRHRRRRLPPRPQRSRGRRLRQSVRHVSAARHSNRHHQRRRPHGLDFQNRHHPA